MHVLLHICCAPCAIGPFEELTRLGHPITGYFYNPNIHPLIEFRRRLKAVKVLQERVPIPVLYEEDYGLEEYLSNVAWQSDERCADCYRLRLTRAAAVAAERGCEAVTTTLLASVHQGYERITQIGRQVAGEHGLEFLAADWRHLYRGSGPLVRPTGEAPRHKPTQ